MLNEPNLQINSVQISRVQPVNSILFNTGMAKLLKILHTVLIITKVILQT